MGSDGRKHVDNCTTQKLRDDSRERLTLATELRCPERLENTHTLRKRRSFFLSAFLLTPSSACLKHRCPNQQEFCLLGTIEMIIIHHIVPGLI